MQEYSKCNMNKCSEHRESFSLMGHSKRNALVHRNFQCLKCEKVFELKGDLKNHMLVQTQEKNFRYSDCGKPLKSHMVVHTQKQKFQCSECVKAFGRNSVLKRHMLVHTQEKKFQCSECGKRFGRMDKLKTHMLLHI